MIHVSNQSGKSLKFLVVAVFTLAISRCSVSDDSAALRWILIDDFTGLDTPDKWTLADTRNDTDPHVANPQVTEIRTEPDGNQFLLKKPAAEGVIGNRKALSFRKLPHAVEVGETWTFFTRIRVEAFPNNHIFGLSNLSHEGILKHDYNAFEPSIRVTDKAESNGFKNDGTIQVRSGDGYAYIAGPHGSKKARPLQPGVWYDLWYVVNNSATASGGQVYDIHIRGGEFDEQTLVYSGAQFRMKRELPLIWFLTNSNTGPKKQPYGNGGLGYDDIFMAPGIRLDAPVEN